MEHQQYRDVLCNLQSEDQILFRFGGDIVTNRFDKEETSLLDPVSIDTALSYRLFSWINNVVLCKGKGKEACKKGEESFRTLFSSLTICEEAEREKANDVFASFLNDTNPITIKDLLYAFSPLALASMIQGHPEEEKEYRRALKKNEAVIFNQATMFVRSVFHAFLTLPNIIPGDIEQDFGDLSNGLFAYRDTLIVPTSYNAYTLKGFRQIALDGLNRLSASFPSETLHSVMVLYLAKDLLAEYRFKD